MMSGNRKALKDILFKCRSKDPAVKEKAIAQLFLDNTLFPNGQSLYVEICLHARRELDWMGKRSWNAKAIANGVFIIMVNIIEKNKSHDICRRPDEMVYAAKGFVRNVISQITKEGHLGLKAVELRDSVGTGDILESESMFSSEAIESLRRAYVVAAKEEKIFSKCEERAMRAYLYDRDGHAITARKLRVKPNSVRTAYHRGKNRFAAWLEVKLGVALSDATATERLMEVFPPD